MTILQPLFESNEISLTAINPETDPQIESGWTHDLDYVQLGILRQARPYSAYELKKKYQEQARKQDVTHDQFHFAIRLKENNRLVGFLRFPQVLWSHGAALLQLSMANLESHQSWGQESLELALAYAFHELNLFRVDVTTAEYQIHLRELLVKTGFQLEIRQRAAAYRSGKTWDRLRYGLLREEYEKTGVTDNPRKTKDPTITRPRKQPAMTPEFLTGGPITDVFRGKLVHLCTLEPERDAECMARWTRDSEYDRLLNGEPAYMWTPKHVEEWLENQVTNGLFFMIRTLSDDRSVGYLDLSDIDPLTGDAWVGIGLGEREYWGQGYGADALEVLLRYAFTELNLQRLSLTVFEYNPRAIRLYEKIGFVHEGQARRFLNRAGRRWDMLFMGILREEWL